MHMQMDVCKKEIRNILMLVRRRKISCDDAQKRIESLFRVYVKGRPNADFSGATKRIKDVLEDFCDEESDLSVHDSLDHIFEG